MPEASTNAGAIVALAFGDRHSEITLELFQTLRPDADLKQLRRAARHLAARLEAFPDLKEILQYDAKTKSLKVDLSDILHLNLDLAD